MATNIYCPECYGLERMRERRPGGNSRCQRGHTYKSDEGLTRTNAINRLEAAVSIAKRQLREFAEENPLPGESTGFADIVRGY